MPQKQNITLSKLSKTNGITGARLRSAKKALTALKNHPPFQQAIKGLKNAKIRANKQVPTKKTPYEAPGNNAWLEGTVLERNFM